MPLEPNQKLAARNEIALFCKLAEENELRWHYSQRRPYTGLGAAPQTWHVNDCSSYASLIFYWAARHAQVKMADPLGMHYSGWGYTGSALEYLEDYDAPRDKYRIGDIAIYGTTYNTVHMTVCRKEGTGDTAVFSSFGRESGPEPRRDIHYHSSPLVGIFRHPALR